MKGAWPILVPAVSSGNRKPRLQFFDPVHNDIGPGNELVSGSLLQISRKHDDEPSAVRHEVLAGVVRIDCRVTPAWDRVRRGSLASIREAECIVENSCAARSGSRSCLPTTDLSARSVRSAWAGFAIERPESPEGDRRPRGEQRWPRRANARIDLGQAPMLRYATTILILAGIYE